MDSNKYLDDISEIKNIMNRSSRFISLSGLSGVMAGVYALIGAYVASTYINKYTNTLEVINDSPKAQGLIELMSRSNLIQTIIIIAVSVIVAAIFTGIILTRKKSKKSGESIWNSQSKRLIANFLLPLVVGGMFCMVLIQQNASGLVSSATLIFYGLACVNASKYTLGDVRYMGIAFIILGLISTQFLGYGLYFWALGFGVCHILYGALMHFKYDQKSK